MVKTAALAVVLASGCTKDNPEFCRADADCETFPGRPFCDVNGEFAESDFTSHTCTTIPADCPIERCGCSPGDGLSCDLDSLTVCNPDGHSTSTVACALGCSTESRCLTFEPSNNLGAALAAGFGEADVIIPDGAVVATDLGTIRDSSGKDLAVKSFVIQQTGAPPIRAFFARSFVIGSASASGTSALAFAAPSHIVVNGRISAAARGKVGGPGSIESPAVCVGHDSQEQGPTAITLGAGGAGNATSGGAGGNEFVPGAPGGAQIPGFEPLVGGCRGGARTNGATVLTSGGGGGGAVQIVSLQEISFTTAGLIDVAGGGGETGAGGGSGGLIVLEAPAIHFNGNATGATGNGGAGGGCGVSGSDGAVSQTPAAAPSCGQNSAGTGGTEAEGARDGAICVTACIQNDDPHKGGGGGSVGRMRAATRDAALDVVGQPIISAQRTLTTLQLR